MRELMSWFGEERWPNRPWILLGKGPTFQQRDEFDLSAWNTLGLNHVVREQYVDVAHVIDLDVIEDCADELERNARWVLMPRYPHLGNEPSLRPLEEFLDAVPVLRRLDDAGRLVWYSASTGPKCAELTIPVRFFSSEAALTILGEMGVRTVRTLGIDGGTSYGASFSALDADTRLANGQPSFDLQFFEFARIAARFGMEVAPLVEPLRIFVGAAERDLPAVNVLEHSLRQHSTVPVRITPLMNVRSRRPRRRANRPRTPFSFARFAIPALCGYKGRAVYLDSDMLVFGDIAELAEMPFAGAAVLCSRQDERPTAWNDSRWFRPGRQFSVMVLDCGALDWDVDRIIDDLDRGHYTYEQLLFEMCIVPEGLVMDRIPSSWNQLERFEPGFTDLLHYTVVADQPWRSADNPLGQLWEAAYIRAARDGAISREWVQRLARRGEVRPWLLSTLDEYAAAPRRGRPPRSAAEVELAATRAQLERLRLRTPVGMAVGAMRAASPLLKGVRSRDPDGALSRLIDRVAQRARALR